MRNITIFLILLVGLAQAQVTLSLNQLDFGDVLTTADRELAINVTNTTSVALEIDDVNVFNTDFTYSIPNATIDAGATEKIRVTFKPRHNLMYNTELIIVLSDGSEHRLDLIGNGKYEGTYYDATFNKSYQDLKDELKTILAAGYTNLGYTGARDKMYGEIDNDAGKVTCVYTGRVATFNTRDGANSNNFNCEHTWPQSLFNQNEPERADIHHLFSTDNPANGQRGNYPFGVVTGTPSWTEGGSKLGGSVFEPRDEQKGATARAMLYFAIRYQDYSNFIDGQEAILRQWHIANEPNTIDITRNENIFKYQKNRNPFVDHPEFIERIDKIGSTDTKPTIKSAEASQNSISYGTVGSAEQRFVYIVNTGNTDWTGVSVATTVKGDLKIKNTSSSVAPGEALIVELGFSGLADGAYTDDLVINMQSQADKIFTIPITFSVGKVSIFTPKTESIKVSYNPMNQSVRVLETPTDAQNISIYDGSGKLVLLKTTFTDIPFGGYTAGIYFVVIKTETGSYSSKFLVY